MYHIVVKYLMELVGTFILVYVILKVYKHKLMGPIAIALALLLSIYLGGPISGGHFNPVVTLTMYLKHKLAFGDAFMYIFAQMIGAYLAILASEKN